MAGIPDHTRYGFDIDRHHQLLHGRGAVVTTTQHTRTQLSHFLNFITSTHIILDLPFGEKKLKLSSNEELTIPNVIESVTPGTKPSIKREDFVGVGLKASQYTCSRVWYAVFGF